MQQGFLFPELKPTFDPIDQKLKDILNKTQKTVSPNLPLWNHGEHILTTNMSRCRISKTKPVIVHVDF